MSDALARVQRLSPEPGRRVLVISDIHANIPYFEGVLRLAEYSDRDELIIDGDFLEKGPESLRTLHMLMEMHGRGHTHVVCGNCDNWGRLFAPDWETQRDARVLRYLQWRQGGLLWDMCCAIGTDPLGIPDFTPVKRELYRAFPREWDFLMSIPHAIETERFVFSHAGMTPGKPLAQHRPEELYRRDRFRDEGFSFGRWLIVGHYPVVLYGEDRVCANPIIDRERRLISIDGGCVLKDDGQLNCLILPDGDGDDFRFVAYDAFPERRVCSDQPGGSRSCYIRWGDNQVQVLQRGREFSRCRHVRSGYELDILTKYLFSDGEFTSCNDCTDYVLPLRAGDRVHVVEKTSRGYFVKHEGVSGWYFGELQ